MQSRARLESLRQQAEFESIRNHSPELHVALADFNRVWPSHGNFGTPQSDTLVLAAATRLTRILCGKPEGLSNADFSAAAPATALRFGGLATIGSTDQPEKPITITARTNGEAYQGYWGRCVHDMAGFRNPGKPVPLDFNHSGGDSIGVANKFNVTPDGLIATGKLTPFKPDDDASRVIAKGRAGVPYQASIVMDPKGLEVEQVKDGQSVQVNGTTFTGPGVVFRRWGINGIAITPYGSDSNTSVQFGRPSPTGAKSQQSTHELTAGVLAVFADRERFAALRPRQK